MMTYELMWDGSIRTFYKGHFIRIWLDKVTVNDIVVDIDIHECHSYDDIVVAAVNYFEKEILKNDNVA